MHIRVETKIENKNFRKGRFLKQKKMRKEYKIAKFL